MKRKMKVVGLMLCLTCSFKAHAQIAVLDGVAHTILTQTGVDQIIYHIQSMAELVHNVQNTYKQLQHMIAAEKRALQNLRSIVDAENFDDLLKWHNRQLYLEKEVEDRFDNLGVKIGNKTYTMTELDGIPGAFRENYGSQYWNDFTEEQRAEMYYKLGLSPANYAYVKVWSAREEALARRFLFEGEILDEENTGVAQKYKHLIDKYREQNENLDSNEILKNTHVTLMQTEMVLRNISRAIAAKDEYEVARNKKSLAPPNPPQLSPEYHEQIFESITGMHVIDEPAD